MYRYIIISILTLLALVGCRKDDPFREKGNPGESPRDGVFSIFTRAEEQPSSAGGKVTFQDGKEVGYQPTQENERIHNWSVIFILQSDRIIKDVCTGTGTPTSGDLTDTHTFTPNVPDGKYDIVAFANMEDTEIRKLVLGETSPATTLKGATALPLKDIKESPYTFAKMENGKVEVDLVPMSGYREGVKIEGNNEVGNAKNRNSVEVIRMLAKVEIIFYNPTATQVNVREIKFGNVQTNATWLMPDYAALDKSEKGAVVSAGFSAANADHKAAVTIEPSIQYVEPKGGVHKEIFYVRESDAILTNAEGGNFFMLSMQLILNENNTPVSQHYASTDRLKWINRNDHIVIPVTIQDYYVDWEVCYYPPIGGYPAVLEDSRPDEFYYFCDFKTPGEFEIKPEIRDSKGNPVNEGFTLTVGTITDEDKIFEAAPKVSLNGDEILGTVGTNAGDAVVSVTITINSESSESPIVRTRNIYIRRSQPNEQERTE